MNNPIENHLSFQFGSAEIREPGSILYFGRTIPTIITERGIYRGGEMCVHIPQLKSVDREIFITLTKDEHTTLLNDFFDLSRALDEYEMVLDLRGQEANETLKRLQALVERLEEDDREEALDGGTDEKYVDDNEYVPSASFRPGVAEQYFRQTQGDAPTCATSVSPPIPSLNMEASPYAERSDVYVPPAFSTPPAMPIATRSKIALILIAFFLGSLGFHYLYLGDHQKFVRTLLLSLLTLGLYGVLSALFAILRVLTGSLKTDFDGVPLQ